MESWDDENFEPQTVANAPAAVLNKWEGEDEDDEVKDNWEDEDEDKPASESTEKEEIKKPKKKSLAEKIAEKERLKREEMERRLREQEEEEVTPEERLRRQKESDLKLALDTTFGGAQVGSGIDGLSIPDTKEEFEEFTDNLSKKLLPLSKNVEYPNFVESLMRNLCATMTSLDIKRIKNTLDNLYLEKQKIEKGDKTKKSKGKGKAKLKLEGENQQLSHLDAYVNDYDDFDDFM